MTKKHRRLTPYNIRTVISDLDKWATGELGASVTWALLEDRHGFSRQSLQAKTEIKAAYDLAKKALSGGLAKKKASALEDNESLILERDRLKEELREYKRKEALWQLRWQRIAFHIRQKGIQVYKADAAIPSDAIPPSIRATAEILRPFDKEVPSSGRI